MGYLLGKSAVVAAGARTLGAAICLGLGERGVNVAVHYDKYATARAADATVAAVHAAGARAIKVQADLT